MTSALTWTHSIITDAHCQVIMSSGEPDPDVFAIGDAAIIADLPLPATAQGQSGGPPAPSLPRTPI